MSNYLRKKLEKDIAIRNIAEYKNLGRKFRIRHNVKIRKCLRKWGREDKK